MAGEANRKIFFNDRNLDISEGYRLFLGGIPDLQDINVNTGDESLAATDFVKRVSGLLHKDRIIEGERTFIFSSLRINTFLFVAVLPLLLEDVNRKMKDWGTEGKMNPFNEVYDVCAFFILSLK